MTDLTPQAVAQMIVSLDASASSSRVGNETAWNAAKMLFAMQSRITALERIERAAIGLQQYLVKSTWAGPLTDDPTKEAVCLLELYAALAPQPAMQEAAE